MASNGSNTIIVVDFYMQACHYCAKFMPEWNRIVEDFTAEYGDQVQFVKVDGLHDRVTAAHYNINSYPSFVVLEANKFGEGYETWRPRQRDYQGMKLWIKGFAGDKITPINSEVETSQAAAVASPIQQASDGAAFDIEKRIGEEEKELTDAVDYMIRQQ